jgi:hypothetical protein
MGTYSFPYLWGMRVFALMLIVYTLRVKSLTTLIL